MASPKRSSAVTSSTLVWFTTISNLISGETGAPRRWPQALTVCPSMLVGARATQTGGAPLPLGDPSMNWASGGRLPPGGGAAPSVDVDVRRVRVQDQALHGKAPQAVHIE